MHTSLVNDGMYEYTKCFWKCCILHLVGNHVTPYLSEYFQLVLNFVTKVDDIYAHLGDL